MTPEVFDQPLRIGKGELADRVDAQRVELGARFRTDAVDLARGKRPDARRDVGRSQHRKAARLVEFGGELRQQLVRRDADRAGESRRGAHRFPDRPRDIARAPPGVVGRIGICIDVLGQRHAGQVDVDLVDPVVLDLRRDRGDSGLEQPRIPAIGVEIGRQQDRVRCELRRLHQAERRMQAECARFVSRRRDDTAADVAGEGREPADHATRRRIDRSPRADGGARPR